MSMDDDSLVADVFNSPPRDEVPAVFQRPLDSSTLYHSSFAYRAFKGIHFYGDLEIFILYTHDTRSRYTVHSVNQIYVLMNVTI